MRTITSMTLLGTLLLSACGQAPEGGSAPAPRVSPRPELALTASTGAPAPALSRVPLGRRLTLEASDRPRSGVRPAQLFAALQRQGILLSRQRQVLASTVGARYCELAVSDGGLGVTLCEYTDQDAARAGSESSHRLFDAIVPGRTLISHAGSVLTLTHAESERARRESRAIVDTFQRLAPSTGER